MRRIINGLDYDTEKATQIWAWDNGISGFGYCEETLYQTVAGNWFIVGKSGPMGRYAERVDSNEWTGGSQLFAIKEHTARAWLERDAPAHVYEKHFAVKEA